MGHSARHGLAVVAALVLALATVGGAAAESPSPSGALATDDTYAVAEDTTLTVAAPGIVANDAAPPTSCVAALDTTQLAGSVAVGADGALGYEPPSNFTGETSFTYGLQLVATEGCPGPFDGQATVRITVTPVNDAPTAVADSFQALRGTTLTVGAPGVLRNDIDVDGDVLTASKASNAVHGVVALAADGSFTYTPNTGFTGADAFSYRASDGTTTSPSRLVTIQVTAVPAPTPTPSPTPAPTASAEPSPTSTPEPSPSNSAEPSPTDESVPTFEVATAAPSPTPLPSISVQPAAREGGLSLPLLLVLVLLVVLVTFGGVFGLTRWLDARRGSGVDT